MPPPPPATAAPNRAQLAKESDAAEKRRKEKERQKEENNREKKEREDKKRRDESGIDLIKPERNPPPELWRPSPVEHRMKFHNRLPDVPFGSKPLAFPHKRSQFTAYAPTSLERMHQFEVLCEPNLGIPIDLIDLTTYQPPPRKDGGKVELHPTDRRLIEKAKELQRKKASIAAGGNEKTFAESGDVSWLNKAVYLSNDLTKFKHRTKGGMDQVEMRGHGASREAGRAVEKLEAGTTREQQIASIKAGFDGAHAAELVHPANKALSVVEVFDVVPDFDNWRNRYVQVDFDVEPLGLDGIGKHRGKADAENAMYATNEDRLWLTERSILRVLNKDGNFEPGLPADVIGYMVPSRKRKASEPPDDGSEPYQWVREYVYHEKEEAVHTTEDEFYLFHVCADAKQIRYCPLARKHTLKKNAAAADKADFAEKSVRYTSVSVHTRDPTEKELARVAELEARLGLAAA